MKRRAQIETAHRIRLLSRGVPIPDATPAERRAALKRQQVALERQKEQEATDE